MTDDPYSLHAVADFLCSVQVYRSAAFSGFWRCRELFTSGHADILDIFASAVGSWNLRLVGPRVFGWS